MSETAVAEVLVPRKPLISVDNFAQSIPLTLVVTDHETVGERVHRDKHMLGCA